MLNKSHRIADSQEDQYKLELPLSLMHKSSITLTQKHVCQCDCADTFKRMLVESLKQEDRRVRDIEMLKKLLDQKRMEIVNLKKEVDWLKHIMETSATHLNLPGQPPKNWVKPFFSRLD